ncbi:MAG: ABC transporter permease, partial [Planctomycetota bacterium]
MSLWQLVARSLGFYWRTHAAVLLAVVVATGVLTGALVVGDSVQYTLRRTVEARLGRTQFAVVPQDRYFRASLADDLQKRSVADVAPALQVAGIIANDDGSRRVNRVEVLGVDERFYAIGPGDDPFDHSDVDAAVLSEAVAQRLGVAAGDEVLLRVEKPGLMPRDVPLASDAGRTVAFRLTVQGIAGDSAFGRFDLKANQAASLNVFVPLAWLGEQIEQAGRANMLLAAGIAGAAASDELNAAVESSWELADAGLELRRLEGTNELELRSRRIFIDESLGAEALGFGGNAVGVLTYFVNEIRSGQQSTPYSTVAALGAGGGDGPIASGMRPDEIVINQWLADDLGARVGDALDLTYYLVGAKRELFERTSRFTVIKIVPIEGAAADPTLMPDFPGLADAENCRDWEPGIRVDLDRIRPKDEDYWDKHRGTPKAFATLEAGQNLWRNRYGGLTAVRFPWREGVDRDVASALTGSVDPATVGLFFQPVRQRGLRAGREGTDFGQLFLGLSMFLIAAAVILTGLLFIFGVETRCAQVGLLLAVGLPAGRVKHLLMTEGGLVSLFGSVVGVGAGLLYTQVLVYGLSTLWRGAVAGTIIYFHAEPATLLIGGLGGLVVAMLAIWITLRRHVTRPARELLEGHLDVEHARGAAWASGRQGLVVAVVSFIGVALFLVLLGGRGAQAAAGGFLGAGALMLLGGVGLCQATLRIIGGGWNRPMVSLGGLGFRNTTRRSGRSLAVIGLL